MLQFAGLQSASLGLGVSGRQQLPGPLQNLLSLLQAAPAILMQRVRHLTVRHPHAQQSDCLQEGEVMRGQPTQTAEHSVLSAQGALW